MGQQRSVVSDDFYGYFAPLGLASVMPALSSFLPKRIALRLFSRRSNHHLVSRPEAYSHERLPTIHLRRHLGHVCGEAQRVNDSSFVLCWLVTYPRSRNPVHNKPQPARVLAVPGELPPNLPCLEQMKGPPLLRTNEVPGLISQ